MLLLGFEPQPLSPESFSFLTELPGTQEQRRLRFSSSEITCRRPSAFDGTEPQESTSIMRVATKTDRRADGRSTRWFTKSTKSQ